MTRGSTSSSAIANRTTDSSETRPVGLRSDFPSKAGQYPTVSTFVWTSLLVVILDEAKTMLGAWVETTLIRALKRRRTTKIVNHRRDLADSGIESAADSKTPGCDAPERLVQWSDDVIECFDDVVARHRFSR